jgi:Ca2+-binding RTX toxin-like protein
VENLVLTSTTGAHGIGNSANNLMVGGSAADTLEGAGGNDTLMGGAGNDLYSVEDAGDVVKEDLNSGIDTVQAHVSYT